MSDSKKPTKQPPNPTLDDVGTDDDESKRFAIAAEFEQFLSDIQKSESSQVVEKHDGYESTHIVTVNRALIQTDDNKPQKPTSPFNSSADPFAEFIDEATRPHEVVFQAVDRVDSFDYLDSQSVERTQCFLPPTPFEVVAEPKFQDPISKDLGESDAVHAADIAPLDADELLDVEDDLTSTPNSTPFATTKHPFRHPAASAIFNLDLDRPPGSPIPPNPFSSDSDPFEIEAQISEANLNKADPYSSESYLSGPFITEPSNTHTPLPDSYPSDHSYPSDQRGYDEDQEREKGSKESIFRNEINFNDPLEDDADFDPIDFARIGGSHDQDPPKSYAVGRNRAFVVTSTFGSASDFLGPEPVPGAGDESNPRPDELYATNELHLGSLRNEVLAPTVDELAELEEEEEELEPDLDEKIAEQEVEAQEFDLDPLETRETGTYLAVTKSRRVEDHEDREDPLGEIEDAESEKDEEDPLDNDFATGESTALPPEESFNLDFIDPKPTDSFEDSRVGVEKISEFKLTDDNYPFRVNLPFKVTLSADDIAAGIKPTTLSNKDKDAVFPIPSEQHKPKKVDKRMFVVQRSRGGQLVWVIVALLLIVAILIVISRYIS